MGAVEGQGTPDQPEVEQEGRGRPVTQACGQYEERSQG